MAAKEIEKVEKRPVEKTEEMTWAGNTYQPDVDIWETPEALMLAADVPGVRKDDLEIDLRDGVLTVSASLSLKDYEGLRPLYSEYNVGNFHRRFTLGETIDQEKISATVDNGVLTLTLPKREKAMTRRIAIA